MREPIGVGRVTGRSQLRPLVIDQRGDRRVLGLRGRATVIFQQQANGGAWADVAAWPAGTATLRELMAEFLGGAA